MAETAVPSDATAATAVEPSAFAVTATSGLAVAEGEGAASSRSCGVEVSITSEKNTLLESDGILIPGVGSFQACMKGILAHRGDEIVDKRLAGGRPVLAICVGMQIMFSTGIEHAVMTQGLSQWPGQVDLLEADVIPHMGWNTVQVSDSSKLFRGIENERFYFVHSYGVRNWVMSSSHSQDPPILTWTTHGKPFIAAVENGPLTATQFHPEKSGEAGIKLLSNWIAGFKNG